MQTALANAFCDLELSASLKNVGKFRDELRQVWEARGLPKGILNALLLVITELCNNACEYSDPAPEHFYLTIMERETGLGVMIRDDGQSFDPHDGVHPNFWNEYDHQGSQEHLGAGCYLALHYFPDLVYVPAVQSRSGMNEIHFEIDLKQG